MYVDSCLGFVCFGQFSANSCTFDLIALCEGGVHISIITITMYMYM